MNQELMSMSHKYNNFMPLAYSDKAMRTTQNVFMQRAELGIIQNALQMYVLFNNQRVTSQFGGGHKQVYDL